MAINQESFQLDPYYSRIGSFRCSLSGRNADKAPQAPKRKRTGNNLLQRNPWKPFRSGAVGQDPRHQNLLGPNLQSAGRYATKLTRRTIALDSTVNTSSSGIAFL